MPEYYKIKSETLTSIANAIRQKNDDVSEQMTPLQMPNNIIGISSVVKDTWVLTSDYHTTTQGMFYGSYCDRNFEGIQYFDIENNTDTSSYKARYAYVQAKNGAPYRSWFVFGEDGNMSARASSSGILFNMSAGSIITRYKIKYMV